MSPDSFPVGWSLRPRLEKYYIMTTSDLIQAWYFWLRSYKPIKPWSINAHPLYTTELTNWLSPWSIMPIIFIHSLNHYSLVAYQRTGWFQPLPPTWNFIFKVIFSCTLRSEQRLLSSESIHIVNATLNKLQSFWKKRTRNNRLERHCWLTWFFIDDVIQVQDPESNY